LLLKGHKQPIFSIPLSPLHLQANKKRMNYRIEKDTMGEVQVPADVTGALKHNAA
jgi:hypothetical protein